MRGNVRRHPVWYNVLVKYISIFVKAFKCRVLGLLLDQLAIVFDALTAGSTHYTAALQHSLLIIAVG